MRLSNTEENYIKAIYHIGLTESKPVSNNSIANRLNTKAASVTDMLRRLAEKDFIKYEPYKGSELTSSGHKVAISIIRKHRLWETFLVEKLEFGWEEVHEIAEQLEHIRSAKLTEKLSAFLGHPEYDPHGDPIPNENGDLPLRENLTLDKIPSGKLLLVKGVKDTSADFLKYIRKIGIAIGDQISISHIEDFDQSMTISVQGANYNISAKAASNIYVKEI